MPPPPNELGVPLQLPLMVQIMPERSGNVHVRAALKYWVVNVPVKNPDVVATGVMAVSYTHLTLPTNREV